MHGGSVCGHKDHRVVMALSVLGACLEDDVVVEDVECVNITFPGFFSELCHTGVKVFQM